MSTRYDNLLIFMFYVVKVKVRFSRASSLSVEMGCKGYFSGKS